MANLSKPTVAAFDFDGTLTHRDSLLPFLYFVTGTTGTFINLLLETPHLIRYLLNGQDRQSLKEAIMSRFLKNFTRQEIQAYGEQFAKQVLPKMILPEGLKKIAWHKNQGHQCLLISANLDIYLVPWGQMNGFHHIITSRVEFSNAKVTGHLIGLNCRGQEKVRRLEEIMGPKENYLLYAYGDSSGDRELLDLADYPYYKTFKDKTQ